jgi:hypothetical protein
MIRVVVVVLAAACAASLSAQAVVHIPASKDNTLYESTTGNLSNGAGTGFFCGVTNMGKKRRGLIAFDVAGGLPPGATVVSAALVLEMTQTAGGPIPIDVRRLTADWGEGTSYASGGNGGSGTTPTAGDATWIHRFYPGSPWATSGGDYAAIVSATTSVWLSGTYTWSSAQLTADVADMLANPAGNFGWMVKSPENVLGDSKRFATREEPYAPLQPRLVVTYAAPPAASVTDLGFGCSGLQLAATGTPRIGSTAFGFTLSGGPFGVGGFVVVSDGVAPGSLALGGGCFVDLELLSALSYVNSGISLGPVYFDGAGYASFQAPVPPTAAIHGASVYVQGLSAGTAFTSSNVLQLVLGS